MYRHSSFCYCWHSLSLKDLWFLYSSCINVHVPQCLGCSCPYVRQTLPQPLHQHPSVLRPCGTTADHNEWITKHHFFTNIISLASEGIHANGDAHFSKLALHHIKKTPFDFYCLETLKDCPWNLYLAPALCRDLRIWRYVVFFCWWPGKSICSSLNFTQGGNASL